MNTPTPNPRPEWITAAAEVIEDVAIKRIGRDLGTIHRDEIVAAGLRAALAKVAYEIRAELVCCDVYDRDAGTDRAGNTHPICFWSEAAARIVEQRPDAPAESSAAASSVRVEGSGQRCPSRIAHESGVVVGCQRPVGHWGTTHGGGSPLVWWEDDDDRAIAGSGHPQPARHGTDGHDGYMSIRCDEGRPGCVGRGCICRCHVGHPLPILSNDTPEGDTDATH